MCKLFISYKENLANILLFHWPGLAWRLGGGGNKLVANSAQLPICRPTKNCKRASIACRHFWWKLRTFWMERNLHHNAWIPWSCSLDLARNINTSKHCSETEFHLSLLALSDTAACCPQYDPALADRGCCATSALDIINSKLSFTYFRVILARDWRKKHFQPICISPHLLRSIFDQQQIHNGNLRTTKNCFEMHSG